MYTETEEACNIFHKCFQHLTMFSVSSSSFKKIKATLNCCASLHLCAVTGNIVHCEPENVLVTALPGYIFSFNLQIHFYPYVISYFISETLLTVLFFVNITEELEFYMEVYCRCHLHDLTL